jgi:E3 ubiquitin-protein ligase TRIP12
MKYLFQGLGKFVARSMLDSRIIDIHFNPLFFRLAEKEEDDQTTILSLKAVDRRLCDSLKLLDRFADAKRAIQANMTLNDRDMAKLLKKIRIDETSVEDLALDFTLPGYGKIELKVFLMLTNINL